MPEESEPEESRYYYVYRIRITNEGTEHAKLLSRNWLILDAHNRSEEVVGEGVVGKQPDLGPGELFEYTSFCPLRTEWGTMEGTYTFRRPDGEEFEATIGRFFLVPSAENAIVVDS
ncbi:MAG: Co2+/Mg2+ efflux protein ApaG [bacterium]|nr:Co2+/Mg2+ efflux protein ApaG [bacterium]